MKVTVYDIPGLVFDDMVLFFGAKIRKIVFNGSRFRLVFLEKEKAIVSPMRDRSEFGEEFCLNVWNYNFAEGKSLLDASKQLICQKPHFQIVGGLFLNGVREPRSGYWLIEDVAIRFAPDCTEFALESPFLAFIGTLQGVAIQVVRDKKPPKTTHWRPYVSLKVGHK